MSLERLGLTPEATVEEVKVAYRRLAMIHHPDRGGDAAAFDQLVVSYKAAMLEASEPTRCKMCNGLGKTWQGRGFQRLAMSCMACGGTGKVER